MPKERKVSGNMFDSYAEKTVKGLTAEQAIEAENQKFFDRMDRRYARIYTWANNREKDEVTEQLALLLLLTLEDKKRTPIREKVMGEMLSEAYGKQRTQWMASKTGGRNAGDQKKSEAALWHAECVKKARKLLKEGIAPHDLSSKLAKNYGKTSKHVRTVLQGAGVLKKREVK